MTPLRLYIFIGYPGAGKTSVARCIHETTGAVHIWADHERHQLFPHPTHTPTESRQLYHRLNAETDRLLGEGKSVIFDTNFNFRHDRDALRRIAAKHGAQTVLIWVRTPLEIAKQRAVHDSNLRNGYEAVMTSEHFDEIAAKLEPPTTEEEPIAVDGTSFDATAFCKQLGI